MGRSLTDQLTNGPARAPHRSLLRALGIGRADAGRPLIGVANSFNELIPGHMHLRSIAEQVKYGVYQAGGIPLEFDVIGVCDGLAMNHEGMNYSLVSREVIADSVEIMARAHALDGLVLIPNCDKVVPGMVMAAARLDLPVAIVSGGPMLAGFTGPAGSRTRTCSRQWAPTSAGRITADELCCARGRRLSHLRLLRGPVHGQLHELSDRVSRAGLPGDGDHTRRLLCAAVAGEADRAPGRWKPCGAAWNARRFLTSASLSATLWCSTRRWAVPPTRCST